MKYVGQVTAILVMMAASAAFAQASGNPPASDQQQATQPAAPAAPPPAPAPVTAQAPAAPAPAAPAPAAAPKAPEPAAAPAEASPSAPPPAAAEAAPAEPAAKETPAPVKKKKKAPAKNPPRHAVKKASSEEWPDSPALANRPQTKAAPDMSDSGAIPALPLDVMTNGLVTYVTGGIGDEELDQLRTVGNNFNLHVLFSSINGEYISNVMVRLLNDKGMEVLSVMNAGPYLYARLEPGHYTVEATDSQGVVKTAKVTVPAKGFARQHIAYK